MSLHIQHESVKEEKKEGDEERKEMYQSLTYLLPVTGALATPMDADETRGML